MEAQSCIPLSAGTLAGQSAARGQAASRVSVASKPASLALKLTVGLGATALNVLVYLAVNHATVGTARRLPWSALDASMPFVPLTVWVYLTEHILVTSAFLLCRTQAEVRCFARAFAVMLLCGCTVHLLWPTTFPRELYPVAGPGLTAFAFSALRAVDLPTSCLPSIHVAGSCLAALALWRNPNWQRWTWCAWAGAITISTVTAKQHYVADVLGGIALAGLLWVLFFLREAQAADAASA